MTVCYSSCFISYSLLRANRYLGLPLFFLVFIVCHKEVLQSHAYPFHNLTFIVKFGMTCMPLNAPSDLLNFTYVISTADIVAMRTNAVETTIIR